jgi:hypothetical protein
MAITTVLGDNVRGLENSGLTSPSGLATDDQGVLYVADNVDHRIVRWDSRDQTASVLAGTTGQIGYAGDGGLAELARLNNPIGLAVDNDLRVLYFCDFSNNCVRSVDLLTGVIATIAGTGHFGFNGDGLPATQTQLAYPVAIAIDAIGRIFITDQRNQRIRVVDSNTNLVETVAGCGRIGAGGDGGPAVDAELNFPVGVVLDAAGNCYFVDQGNARIRCVHASDGTLTTIAAVPPPQRKTQPERTRAAELRRPSFLPFAPSGKVLLVCEQENNQICAIVPGTSTIHVVAGNGRAGLGGDGGPPLEAALNNPGGIAVFDTHVFVADKWNHCVRQFDLADVEGALRSGDLAMN